MIGIGNVIRHGSINGSWVGLKSCIAARSNRLQQLLHRFIPSIRDRQNIP
jgi:hypothetical protein